MYVIDQNQNVKKLKFDIGTTLIMEVVRLTCMYFAAEFLKMNIGESLIIKKPKCIS